MKSGITILGMSLLLLGMLALPACYDETEYGYPYRSYYYGYSGPSVLYGPPPVVAFGDWDDWHRWHDRDWWVDHDHVWVHRHHPEWFERHEWFEHHHRG